MKSIRCASSRIIFTLLIAYSALASIISAQQPRRGSISGQVIADAGVPIEKVTVRLIAPVRDAAGQFMLPSVATPDREGRFVFSNLAPRSYRISASAPGYVTKTNPDAASSYLRLGDTTTLELVKGGVITGRVIDMQGEPVVVARVTAIRVRDETGKMIPYAASTGALTDDRGVYRIYGLFGGSYIVAVNFNSMSMLISPQDSSVPIYYPSSGRADAGEVRVTAGSESGGIDINYRREIGHSISGTVELNDSTASPVSLNVGLREHSSLLYLGATPVNVTANGREFTFRGVANGEYVLSANGRLGAAAPGATFSSASQRVSVRGKDVSGIRLVMIKHGGISGSVEIEPTRAALPPACKQLLGGDRDEVVVSAGGIATGEISSPFSMMSGLIDQGQFMISPLMPGRYHLSFNLPGERWYPLRVVGPLAAVRGTRIVDLGAHSLLVNEGETLGGVIITLAEGASAVSGRVNITDGRARVHLIPAEPSAANQLLRYAEAVSDREGRFQLRHLAPGRYYIVAVNLADQSEATSQRPKAWDEAGRSELHRLAETTKKVIELQPCQRMVNFELSPTAGKK